MTAPAIKKVGSVTYDPARLAKVQITLSVEVIGVLLLTLLFSSVDKFVQITSQWTDETIARYL